MARKCKQHRHRLNRSRFPVIVVRRGIDKCPSSSSSYPAIKLISESSESKLVSKSDDSEDIVMFSSITEAIKTK